MISAIDHLVVAARSREDGVAWIADVLGVQPRIGGEHARMGTHNALVRLGDAIYLEVIAPNPDAPPPARARWFDLDGLAPSARPRLATWVIRTSDIDAAAALTSLPLGPSGRRSAGRRLRPRYADDPASAGRESRDPAARHRFRWPPVDVRVGRSTDVEGTHSHARASGS